MISLNSLPSKIRFGMFALVVFSTFASMFLTAGLLFKSNTDSIKAQLNEAGTSLLIMGLTDYSELQDYEQLSNFIDDSLQTEKADKIIQIYDSSKKLIFSTIKSLNNPELSTLEGEFKKPSFITIENENKKYESIVIPFKGKRRQNSYLQIIMPVSKYSQILKTFWLPSTVFAILLIIFSMVVAKLLAEKITKPVRQLAKNIEDIDLNQIEAWQPIGNIEKGQYLAPIGKGINALMEKTKSAVIKLRKITRFVAHELRTPLTIIQGEAETVLMHTNSSKEDYKKVLQSALEEVEKMSDIVTTVLKIRQEDGLLELFEPETIDVSDWLKNNIVELEKTLGRKIIYTAEIASPNIVNVDPKLLFRLIDNLIRNIQQHTPSNTNCEIKLLKKYDKIQIHISDNGCGLPVELLQSLNKKHLGLDISGIGLSLCLRIAELCKLHLDFENRSDGGLNITIQFQ